MSDYRISLMARVACGLTAMTMAAANLFVMVALPARLSADALASGMQSVVAVPGAAAQPPADGLRSRDEDSLFPPCSKAGEAEKRT